MIVIVRFKRERTPLIMQHEVPREAGQPANCTEVNLERLEVRALHTTSKQMQPFGKANRTNDDCTYSRNCISSGGHRSDS